MPGCLADGRSCRRGSELVHYKKALRVDVDLHPDRAALLRAGGEHGADEALHVRTPLALHQQAEAVAAADQRQRRLGRPEHVHVAGRRRGAAQAARMRFRVGARLRADDDAGKPAERRQMRRLALGDLLLVEALGIAGDDRPHHRMVRLEGLQQAEALLAGAPGPAGHLAEQLEGALGGARIAIGEAEIGIDDADQRHVGKIVPLGDQLRADDDVGLALGDRLELEPQPPDAAHDVGRQHDGARVGKMPDDLLGDPLDARAAGDQMVERAAFRAGLGPLFVMAAMMADELAAKAVLDQPARAVRALEAVAADAAERQRRIAAPVEEQQRLLAAAEIVSRIWPSRTGDRKPPRAGGARRMSMAPMSGSAASAKRAGSATRA